MSALEAARFGDEIGHTSAMKGLLAGLVIGLLVTGAVMLAVGATVATGGAAAVVIGGLIAGTAGGGLAGMKIGAHFDSDPMGPIISGSLDTFLGAGRRPAARAKRDNVLCKNHAKKVIAQGSTDVFINKFPAARRTDGTKCSAKIRDGQPDVFFGGPTGTYEPMDAEVPGWLVTTLEVAALIGAGIATGGAIFTVGIGAALGGLVGSMALGYAGEKVGGAIGGIFGEKGRAIGEVAGGFLGSMFGGGRGAKAGAKLEAKLPTATLAKMPGATDAHIQARQTVAKEYYKNSPDFQKNGAPDIPQIEDHMTGIDFTKPVAVKTIDKPTTFSQYQNPPGGRTGNYIAKADTPASKLGIGGQGKDFTPGGPGGVGPKVIQQYEVPAGTKVLQSTSSPKNDFWSAKGTNQGASGGGQQIAIGDKGSMKPIGTPEVAGPKLIKPGPPLTTKPTTPGIVNPRGDGSFTPPNIGGTGQAVGAGTGTSAGADNPDKGP